MIICPCCGRETDVPAHQERRWYTHDQKVMLRRLRKLGVSYKVISRVVGGSPAAVRASLRRTSDHNPPDRMPRTPAQKVMDNRWIASLRASRA